MLNIIIILITILSIISIIILFKLLSGTDIMYKIIVAIIMVVVNLLLANFIYSMCQTGNIIQEVSNVMKPMIIFTLFPINMILIACPLSLQINKWKLEDIDQKQFRKRIIICLIIDIAILFIESINIKMYISNFLN